MFALLFLLVLIVSVLPAPEPPKDAPIAIVPKNGGWIVENDGEGQPKPVLQYRDQTFPDLALDLVKLECRSFGGLAIEVTGLVPAQRFPQPSITWSVGEVSRVTVPNAVYRAASEPHRLPIPGGGKFKNSGDGTIIWPGNPAYATLSFWQRRNAALDEALASGRTLRFTFDRQEQDYPPVPADVVARFRQACAPLAFPPPGARRVAASR